MTDMTDSEFKTHMTDRLKRCNKNLNIGLKENELIKTQYYRKKISPQ
jgi:hypothetical protein